MSVCVIVDGYKFSQDYVRYCKLKGFDCVHIYSTPSLIKNMQLTSNWRADDYVANFTYTGDLPALIKQLKAFDIRAVIPSTEHAVELADTLASYFKTPHNGMDRAEARRDKFLMTEALKEQGVPTVKYFKSNNTADILHWVEQNTTWPVVVKPLKSAGTDNVHFCKSPEQLLLYCNEVMNRKNMFGENNQEVLVQSFLKGTEYVINSVSCNGQHYITDMWQYKKRYFAETNTILYEKENLLPYEGDIQAQLIQYLQRVLNALELRYGACHSEIMLTPEGPILIEIGARVTGNFNLEAHNTCLGHNQMELNVDAYLDAPAFQAKTREPYHLRKHAMLVVLASAQEGTIASIPLLDLIKKLPSFYSVGMIVKSGDHLIKTVDLFSTPGKVMLVHEDLNIIEQDYQTIMHAEAKGFILKNS